MKGSCNWNIHIGIDVAVDMDVDMTGSTRGSLKNGLGAPLKGFGVDRRQIQS